MGIEMPWDPIMPWMITMIALGQGSWCSVEDLYHGRELGLASQMRPLNASCGAAILRTHAWESHKDGGVPWRSMAAALAEGLRLTSARAARWGAPPGSPWEDGR